MHFLKDAVGKSKAKKRRKVGETKICKKPQLTPFSSVQLTKMTRLESHWLGVGHEVEGVSVESKEKPEYNHSSG